jgi:lipid II:glycine glycyltransferase (peptidoglycan interpeptide bridge formation enzyme)
MKFVEGHPDGNIFHTPSMLEVFRRTKNYEPFLFAAIDERDKEIHSLTATCQVKIFNGPLSRVSSRMIGYGGIVSNSSNGRNDGLLELIEFYDRAVRGRALLSEFRNMRSTESFKGKMVASGYRYEEYLNYLVDLKREPAAIFKSFSKGRKSDIKALEKMGVCTKEVNEIKDIETVYGIICQTYSRVKVPISDISLFESAMENLFDKGMARFFLAKLKDKNIASLVALLYKGVITTWYYGTDLEFNRLSPISLLIWHIMKWGSENGYQTLDFGGAGRPQEVYGVRDFKAKFHGEMVNYGRYMKIYSPVMLRIANMGYEVYRKLL